MERENYSIRYVLTENVDHPLSIEGDHVEFDGQGHEVRGWIHIGPGKTLLLKNVVVIQTHPEDWITIGKDGICPICSLLVEEVSEGDKFMVMVHPRSESSMVDGIKMLASDTLTSFGSFGKDGPKELLRCRFNGENIPDYIRP
jgi:hypothetical protein